MNAEDLKVGTILHRPPRIGGCWLKHRFCRILEVTPRTVILGMLVSKYDIVPEGVPGAELKGKHLVFEMKDEVVINNNGRWTFTVSKRRACDDYELYDPDRIYASYGFW